ncbi:hypothetical protein C8R46DRAFT_1042698 [Mycena filopes]|nr:hypothetical protein C8R46DRAFT_1042698 [Mycena filopes]
MPSTSKDALAAIDAAATQTLLDLRALEGLQHKHRALQHLHNQHILASTLAPEILSQIFHLTLTPEWFGVHDDSPRDDDMRRLPVTVPVGMTLLACAQVCHHWREVALGAHCLWGQSIDFTRHSRRHVETIFARADTGKKRREVWCNLDAFTFPGGLEDILGYEEPAKLVALRIVGDVDTPPHHWDEMDTLEDELTTALAIKCHLYGLPVLIINGGTSYHFKLPQQLFGEQYWSHLHSVTLTHCADPDWDSLLGSNSGFGRRLVNLTLEDIVCNTTGTFRSFAAFLGRCTVLQTLRIMYISFFIDFLDQSRNWEVIGEGPSDESSEPLPLLALEQVTISYPCRSINMYNLDWSVHRYIAMHLASIMVIVPACRMDLILPQPLDSAALPHLGKLAARGEVKNIPLLQYALRVWHIPGFHFVDLYTMDGEVGRDNFPDTSRFRLRQDIANSQTENLEATLSEHTANLPLSQVLDVELDADLDALPYGLYLEIWENLLLGASVVEVIRIPRSLNLAIYVLRHAAASVRRMILTGVNVELRLETALKIRKQNGKLHPDFELVLRDCTAAGELLTSLGALCQVTWASRQRDSVENNANTQYDGYWSDDEAELAENGNHPSGGGASPPTKFDGPPPSPRSKEFPTRHEPASNAIDWQMCHIGFLSRSLPAAIFVGVPLRGTMACAYNSHSQRFHQIFCRTQVHSASVSRKAVKATAQSPTGHVTSVLDILGTVSFGGDRQPEHSARLDDPLHCWLHGWPRTIC